MEMDMSKYIELDNCDIDVQEIKVRVNIDDLLGNISDSQLLEAMSTEGRLDAFNSLDDDDKEAVLDHFSDEQLLEALNVSAVVDEVLEALDFSLIVPQVIEAVREANVGEAIARSFLDGCSTEERIDFLQRFYARDVVLAADVAKAPTLQFRRDTVGAPVEWVEIVEEGKEPRTTGMILVGSANAKMNPSVRMFIGEPDDTMWIESPDMDAAHAMARGLYEARVLRLAAAAAGIEDVAEVPFTIPDVVQSAQPA